MQNKSILLQKKDITFETTLKFLLNFSKSIKLIKSEKFGTFSVYVN